MSGAVAVTVWRRARDVCRIFAPITHTSCPRYRCFLEQPSVPVLYFARQHRYCNGIVKAIIAICRCGVLSIRRADHVPGELLKARWAQRGARTRGCHRVVPLIHKPAQDGGEDIGPWCTLFGTGMIFRVVRMQVTLQAPGNGCLIGLVLHLCG